MFIQAFPSIPEDVRFIPSHRFAPLTSIARLLEIIQIVKKNNYSRFPGFRKGCFAQALVQGSARYYSQQDARINNEATCTQQGGNIVAITLGRTARFPASAITHFIIEPLNESSRLFPFRHSILIFPFPFPRCFSRTGIIGYKRRGEQPANAKRLWSISSFTW